MDTKSNVNDIGILQSLYQALPQYCDKSFHVLQGFASVLSNKIKYLESLKSHFVRKIEAAEAALNRCEIARASDPPESKRSCSSQAHALARAEANYQRYQSIMARVDQTHSEYEIAERSYANSLHSISSSTVPKFAALITKLSNYNEVGKTADIGRGAPGASVPGTSPGAQSTPASGSEKRNSDNATSAHGGTNATNGGESAENGINDGNGAANTASNATDNEGIGTATVVGGGIAVGVAAAMIASYLKGRGNRNYWMGSDEILIDNAFREQYGVGKTEILLMQSPKREEYTQKYNAFCQEVETEVKKQYTEKIEEEKAFQKLPEKQEYDNAVLAGHVYNPNAVNDTNWNIVSLNDISRDDSAYKLVKKINEFNHGKSGFYAQLYKNEFTGEYTLTFKGSDVPEFKWRDLNPTSLATSIAKGDYHLDDWLMTNTAQGLGLSAKQYDNAKKLGEIIRDSGLKDANLRIVGHSLGGGLATVAGLESKCPTYTYNQAELTHDTIERLNLDTTGHEKIITAYHDSKEPLIKVQNLVNDGAHYLTSETLGRSMNKSEFHFAQDMFAAKDRDAARNIQIDSPDNYFSRLGKVEYINSKGKHGMDYVSDYFKNKHKNVLNTNLNSNLINYDEFQKDFKIERISDAYSGKSKDMELFEKSLKDSGFIGVVSKK